MLKLIQKSGWPAGGLIFFTPILLIFFLASQMAYGQVRGRFVAYDRIPEITNLAQLQSLERGTVVMLRGQISEATTRPVDSRASGLVIYQERPAEGRDARFREEFPLVFPEFVVDLPDGAVAIMPSLTKERVIRHEIHTVQAGDRQYTGFRVGDTVTVQGQWQPSSGTLGALYEATGITSTPKSELMVEWQSAFTYVSWARNGFGLLTLLGLSLLILAWRRARRERNREEDEAWPTPETTTTAPTT